MATTPRAKGGGGKKKRPDDPFGDKAFVSSKRPKPATADERRKDVPPTATAATPEAPKRGRGAPRLLETPEQMEELADAYFADCVARAKPSTVPGLCYALGFTDRHALADYEKRKEFAATAKKLRLRIEQDRVESLLEKGTFSPGQIFDLKNNFGYVDKQEVEHSGNVGIMERITRARGRR